MRVGVTLLVVCCTAGLLSAEVVQQKGHASLAIAASEKRDGAVKLPFVETLRMTLTVEGRKGLEVEWPKSVLSSTEHWEVQAVGAERRVRTGEEGVRWQREVLVAPRSVGMQSLELEPLRYRNPGEGWQSVNWEPISVDVTLETRDVGVSSLRGDTGIEKLPGRGRSRGEWMYVVLALVVAVVGLVVWWRARSPRGSRRESPAEIAVRELDRIVAYDLPGRGKSARFHGLVANVLRRYIEGQLGIAASSRTTAEFVRDLDQRGLLTEEQRDRLRVLFERCDVVKFGRVVPTSEECAALEVEVRRVVAETKEPVDAEPKN